MNIKESMNVLDGTPESIENINSAIDTLQKWKCEIDQENVKVLP